MCVCVGGGGGRRYKCVFLYAFPNKDKPQIYSHAKVLSESQNNITKFPGTLLVKRIKLMFNHIHRWHVF